MSTDGHIDVHHHPFPPSYLDAMAQQGPVLGLSTQWTAARSIADMDHAGVATAILSTPHSGDIWDALPMGGRALARDWNEYMAGMASDHPGRFGSFAVVPMPDIDGSLRELEYALDELHADGIGLCTNIGDKWLGDPIYAPIFAELNRRRAVVYVHPIAPTCCAEVITPELNFGGIDLPADTTRAISRMLFSGSARRYPDIRFIFSHGGGTMPFLVERLLRVPIMNPKLAEQVPDGVLAELKKFHYELAQASHPGALASVTALIATSHLLFGTDYPVRTAEEHVRSLTDFDFSPADLAAILAGNARRLLPRWRSSGATAAPGDARTAS